MATQRGNWPAALGLGTLSVCALVWCCHWYERPALAQTDPIPLDSVATSQPASGPASVIWDDRSKGVKLRYPADWRPRKNPDYELMLLPAGTSQSGRRITLDVPDLPPHLPFMIQMKRIEHDYLEDLKKEHPDLHVEESREIKLPDAIAKLVRSSWRRDKVAYDDVALLMIHASAVYILDAQTDDPKLATTRAAFDSIESSIEWMKK